MASGMDDPHDPGPAPHRRGLHLHGGAGRIKEPSPRRWGSPSRPLTSATSWRTSRRPGPRPTAHLRGAHPHGAGFRYYIDHLLARQALARGEMDQLHRAAGEGNGPADELGCGRSVAFCRTWPPGERRRGFLAGTAGLELREPHARGGREDPSGHRDARRMGSAPA